MEELERQIYKKYYDQLTADQLMLAVIDEHFIAYSSKPGPWSYDSLEADSLIIDSVKIPGTIWRDQKTHKGCPEPKEEYQEISEQLFRKQGKIRQQYPESILKGLTRYVEYGPLIVKRINALATPILYGQREDTQQLIKEYLAGNRELLPMIKNQLGGIIYKAEKRFREKYTGEKVEVFTDLAGKINKKLKKPERIYSEKSPAGGGEDPRLFLTMEPFKFTKEDITALADKTLIEALDSYRFAAGANFKTWFYRLFYDGLHDLYREYQHGWRYGHVIKDIEELEEELQNRVVPRLEFEILTHHLTPGLMARLNLNQRRWIALFLKMLPDSLRDKLAAQYLVISTRTENRIRKRLQRLHFKPERLELKQKAPFIYCPVSAADGSAQHKQSQAFFSCYNCRPGDINNDKRLSSSRQPANNKKMKRPAQTEGQKKMMKHYKKFTKNSRVIKYQKGYNPVHPAYKPGICRGSFFPINVKMSAFYE